MKSKRTAFRDGFNALVDASGISVAEISRQTGVPKSLIDKLRQERAQAPNVYDALRLAAFFGKTVEEVAGSRVDIGTDEMLGLLGRLKPDERELVRAQLEGLFARRRPRREPS